MIRRRSAQVLLAARTALAVVTARCVLRLGGFPTAQRFYRLATAEQPTASPGLPLRQLPRNLHIAYRVLRLPVLGSSCLPTSLALFQVLRGRGITPDLVIGVAKNGGAFSAHAWVEVDGHRLDVAGFLPSAHEEIGRFRRVGSSA